jgi:hypothetical protein
MLNVECRNPNAERMTNAKMPKRPVMAEKHLGIRTLDFGRHSDFEIRH